MLKSLRIIGFLEGLSYLALFGITMPLKYFSNIHQPNKIIGMAHGILFVLYCVLVIINQPTYKWTYLKTFWALFASIVPFGTFIADSKIFKKEVVKP